MTETKPTPGIVPGSLKWSAGKPVCPEQAARIRAVWRALRATKDEPEPAESEDDRVCAQCGDGATELEHGVCRYCALESDDWNDHEATHGPGRLG